MRMSLALVALMLVAWTLASCTQEAGDAPAVPQANAPSEEGTSPEIADTTAQAYEAVGMVVSIMANKKFVIIDHEAIPGYMDAMSMPFPVADSTVLRGIQPGDSIRFSFTPVEGVKHIEKKE
ncbi:MAG: copper-binding protein [Rhodothermales bacterium]